MTHDNFLLNVFRVFLGTFPYRKMAQRESAFINHFDQKKIDKILQLNEGFKNFLFSRPQEGYFGWHYGSLKYYNTSCSLRIAKIFFFRSIKARILGNHGASGDRNSMKKSIKESKNRPHKTNSGVNGGFSFPLNVHARLLSLEEGHVESLYYGVFNNDKESIRDAQRNFTRLLLERFPSPPRRVLEIGCGVGTSAKFEEHGYGVTVLAPTAEHYAIAKKFGGKDADIQDVCLTEMVSSTEPVDVILVLESVRYFDPLELFNTAHALLRDGGLLIIVDEFGLVRNRLEQEALPLLRSVVCQGERCGFSLGEQCDLSRLVAPNLDIVLEMLRKHRRTILEDLPLGGEQFDRLVFSLRDYRKKLKRGMHGHVLLAFRKETPPRYRISVASEDDIPAIQQLFKTVFGHEMSRALWQWKYGDGRGKAILAWRGNELAGHYGGNIRKVLMRDKPLSAIQGCDLMVSPKERTHKGPFFLIAATFLERYCGYGNPYPLDFEFPNARAMRIGALLNLYTEVTKIVEVSWDVSDEPPAGFLSQRPLSPEDPKSRKHIDRLWKAMSKDLRNAVVGIRDHEFIRHRYMRRPEYKYDIILVFHRIWRKAQGLFVVKREAQRCFLLDLVAPMRNIPVMLSETRRFARRHEKTTLSLWITRPFSPLFTQAGGKMIDPGVSIPLNCWTPGPDPESLRDAWWLMAGDTEFL